MNVYWFLSCILWDAQAESATSDWSYIQRQFDPFPHRTPTSFRLHQLHALSYDSCSRQFRLVLHPHRTTGSILLDPLWCHDPHQQAHRPIQFRPRQPNSDPLPNVKGNENTRPSRLNNNTTSTRAIIPTNTTLGDAWLGHTRTLSVKIKEKDAVLQEA